MWNPYYDHSFQSGGPSFPGPSHRPNRSTPPPTPWHGMQSAGLNLPNGEYRTGSPGYGPAYGPSFRPTPPFDRSAYPDELARYGPQPNAYPPSNGHAFASPWSSAGGPFVSAQPPTPGSHALSRASHAGYAGGSDEGYGRGSPARSPWFPGPHTSPWSPPTSPWSPPTSPWSPTTSASHRLEHHSQDVVRPHPPQRIRSLSPWRGKKRKALLIGINYSGQEGQLLGCVNDAWHMYHFLVEDCGFRKDDIVVLTDEHWRDPSRMPTRSNMIHFMKWLVRDAQPDDSLFFLFAGHGDRRKDLDGDEADGLDEAICPVDHLSYGPIIDDDLHRIMVKPLPTGCRLTSVFDCCYSGSALDLPYVYSMDDDCGRGLSRYLRGEKMSVSSVMSGLIRGATLLEWRANRRARRLKASPADVFSWAACMDSQTAAEPKGTTNPTGVMCSAFIDALRHDRHHTYQSLIVAIRSSLFNANYPQKPMLSSSHPMDLALPFTI
ncbi:unnamed protein product [Peniophora sp. CBMAI 1063]|nr:unnamed protein product [Peniophora sp. CBMAI 1063]